MNPEPELDLSGLNTLRLPGRAEWFAAPRTDAALQALLAERRWKGLARTAIGEGSNVLVAGDIPGLVIHPRLAGIRLLGQDSEHVVVEVAAGENWDTVVRHTLEQGWYGLENLSLIPGSAGAAPYQNIGAYGVELDHFLVSLDAVHLATGVRRRFSRRDCRFDYRDSFFRSVEPGQWIILRLRLRLRRAPRPVLSYGDLETRFRELPGSQQTPIGLRRLVCSLRRSKLPDPHELPNAGSFFKNPIVGPAQHERLRAAFPGLVSFPLPDGRFKLAAGWLLERAGWKGHREGPLGMHSRQALVLVHYGGATSADVLEFVRRIRLSIQEHFDVWLEQEPVIMPPDA